VKRLWAFGIGLLLLAAIIQWPAASLAPWVARATDQRWRLASVEGTLWQGRTTVYAYDRPSGRWHAGRGMRWQLAWSELAQGRLAVQLKLDDDGGVRLVAEIDGWALERLDVTLRADQVAALLPGALGEYGWSGTMRARNAQFRCRWKRPDCAGRIELAWERAALPQFTGPVLGDYQLQLTAEGQALRFDLTTLSGRLQITGTGELSDGKLHFIGEAAATGDGAGNLENLLRTLGRPAGVPGRYLIEYREKIT